MYASFIASHLCGSERSAGLLLSRPRSKFPQTARKYQLLSRRRSKMAEMRKVVLVDMDNTLVNWDKEFAKRWAALRPEDSPDIIKHRKHFELEQNFDDDLMPVAIEIMSTPGFFAALEPQPGSIGAIREMSDAGLHVMLCTAPHPLQYETCVAEKYGWVRKWLGEEFLARIVITRDKTIVKGTVLIDDKPVVKGKCVKPDWEHIVFEQPYNLEVDDRPRMKNWAEWKAVLSNYFDMD